MIESIGRGLLGIAVLVGIAFLVSSNKKAINWKLVGIGISIQIVFAIGVLKVEFITQIFQVIADFFVLVLDFTKEGSRFLFGNLLDSKQNYGYIFALQVLPTVIFFSALSSLLYYLGILQKIVYGIAWLLTKTLKLSGAESLSTAGNIFLGQTEAPLLVKPYIEGMNRSEMLCLMTGGMASIAGGVLAAYVGYLGGDDPEQQRQFAKHLLTASIMSAPAAIVMSKIIIPQTHDVSATMKIDNHDVGSNALESIANGTTDGVKLAVNVGAMLLVFTALMAMLNFIFFKVGEVSTLNEQIIASSGGKYTGLTLQYVLGNLFSPIAWVIGIHPMDMQYVGQLLGEKTILNEFYAYTSLGEMMQTGQITNKKSIIITTYALCGFANFASIGIQIGGIGTLAPGKKKMLSELGIRALIAGTLSCLLTGAIVGMLY